MSHDTKDVSRFWGHVDKTQECWLWTRATNGQGYPFFKLKGKMVLGHRLAWALANGPIPEGLVVDHICRNRICVNPQHLQTVSSRENTENLDAAPCNTKTGHLNVYKRKSKSGYVVIVRALGKKHYGGSHATLESAVEAARDLRNRVKTNNLQDR